MKERSILGVVLLGRVANKLPRGLSHKATIVLFCVVTLLTLISQATAEVITVGPWGYDYTTIQAAIDAAGVGDTIRVADGVYAVSEANEVDMRKVQNLTLEAENVGGAVIDGQGSSGTAVYIDNGDNLRGFWVRNAEMGIHQRGGDTDAQAGPWIAERCIITNTGVGIWINQSSGREGNGIVRNCTVYDVTYGGIGTNDGDTLEILNSLIVEVEASSPFNEWGVLAAVVEANSNMVSVDYSNIYNCGQNYNNAWGGLVVGEHMYYLDPCFINPAAGDLHLQLSSPMVDCGVVIEGLWRGYQGSAPDIGAIETIPEPATLSLLAVGAVALIRRRRSK